VRQPAQRRLRDAGATRTPRTRHVDGRER
jgi:hypothetical protein